MISSGFILTSLIVVLIPGTGVIYTVSTGISGNKRNTVYAALGCTLGIVPHLLAGIFGISAIINASAQIFQFVRIIGILYLLYLGFGLIRSSSKLEIEERETEKPLQTIGKAVLLNLLNPKLTLFFLSFLPQFIQPGGMNYFSQMIVLSLIFMGLTLVVFLLYGLLANGFKNHFINSPGRTRRIQQGFGVMMMGFAAKLAFDD